MKRLLHTYTAPLFALLLNLLLVYVVYFIARVAYLLDNWSYFSESLSWEIWQGGLVFDTSAILVTNIPYIAMMLFPLHWKECKVWHLVCKWWFVIINTLALVLNLCDAAYFPYTLRRTTTTVFNEFQNEGNLGGIFLTETLHHWYFVVLAVIVVYGLWKLYTTPKLEVKKLSWWRYDLITFASLAAVAPFVVAGIRGGFTTAVRPITISNANQYVNRPSEAAIVLNTPFSLIRTLGKTTFSDPAYFTPSQLDYIYSPLHQPISAASLQVDTTRRNVVVIIVESFGSEYIGALNNGQGHTPFLDSLIGQSLTFTRSYSNGRKSIDGMPSILSGIPMFVEPFFVTGYSLNDVSGLAGELSRSGYTSAFFHGAENGSMGFEAFARTSGFQSYYGRTEYNRDPRFNGDDDFDGTWAIWDEEFLQFYAATMPQMPQPFVTALFTATSHHPFVVPQRYRDSLHQPGHPIYTCVRYTDHALRRFFHTASQMPWYRNTIFVITADHTNITEQPAYNNPLGTYSVPIIFFDPSGTMPRGRIDAVAQQTDIMPTILGWLA